MDANKSWEEYKNLWGTFGNGPNAPTKEEAYHFHPLFAQTLSINKSVMGVIDKRTMQYLYISENSFEVMYQNKQEYLEKGVEFGFSNIVLEEQRGMIAFSKIINSYFSNLSRGDRARYQCYWDYRVHKTGGGVIRILQRDNVLSYDENGQITIVLFVCIDITNSKQDKNQHLRLTNGKENVIFQYSIKERELKRLEEPSKRELEIAELISQGYTRKEIAEKLNLSFHTITTHCKNVNEKLNVNDSIEMINLLKILGLI